jgi:hypothetical protein
MSTPEEKAQEKAADIERMKRSLFESNKSTDPRLVPGTVSQSVPLMTTVGQHSPVQPEQGRGVEETEPARDEPRQETTIEPIETSLADGIRKFRASPDVVRSNVRVSDDVFSRVTAFFANNRVKKVDILSYLLFAFLPKRKPSGHLPQWLLQIPPVAPHRLNLVYFDNESLSDRFTEICTVYGVTRVDLIENIVRHYLPPAGRVYPPKRPRR